MSVIWVSAAVGTVGVLAAGLLLRKRKPKPGVFADPREERLAKRVANTVGCSLSAALPAVRQEIGYSPTQSDDTLVKRAVYHYQQSIPERTCSTWRDASPG